MTRPTLYPKADANRQWYGDKFSTTDMGGVDKVLLHTTEGAGWPSYRDGAVAPNLTYWPATRQWRQHFPLNRSSRALCDATATAVRENRDKVVQIEIVAICDPKLAPRVRNGQYVGDLSAQAIQDLGEFLAFMHEHYRVPLLAAPKWLPFDASYGNSPVRMTGRQYDAWRGVLGHQHASGNVHGDPGRLDIAAVIRAANKAARPATPAPVWPPTAAILKPPPAPLVPATQEKRMEYRILRTPDNRYWGCCGLQITHLETPEVRNAYLKMAGLSLDNKIEVDYPLLENFQRIT